MEKGHIEVQTQNIFPIIKKFLYSDHEIFLRELISNAQDATNKLKVLASKEVYTKELGDLTIQVSIDKENGTLTISDSGIGMTEQEVKKYLNQVAFSSAQDFIKKYNDDSIIGHFGLGFYSAFMVAEKVEVRTKSYKKSKGITWACKGEPEYEIEENDKKDRGTDIILYIHEESKEFLEQNRIETLLNKYCKYLPIQIQFGNKTNTRFEGEGEDRVEIQEEEPNIINPKAPLWKKKPNRIKEDQYKEFYRDMYPMSQDPMFWIHLNIDFPFNLTGVLYFPKLNNQFEVQKNKIQLYSNQVYVTDEVKEIVPEFLTLLHGVIDSPDIPLNVSRSYLQADHNVKKITGYITKKVAEKLGKLFKKDRESYQDKWCDIGVFVKYGMVSEEKFYDKAVKFTVFENTENEFYTIEEYKEKIKGLQTDKHDKLVMLYTNDAKSHDSYLKEAKSKGYDVLVMNHVIDNHFMQHLEQKDGGLVFVRVDSDTVDNLVQKEEKTESVLSEKQQDKVKSIFEGAMEDLKSKMQLKPLSPDSHPVLITRPEFMRRMTEMQQLQGMGGMGMDDFYNVVVNTNHPLIAEKLINMKGQERKESFASYLVNLAKLNQNMLKGEALTDFIKRSLEFVK